MITSPGFLVTTASCRSLTSFTGLPSTDTITSPPMSYVSPSITTWSVAACRPAPAAGPSGMTLATIAPSFVPTSTRSASVWSTGDRETPSQACLTTPSARRPDTTSLTMSIGTAKPMPTLPSVVPPVSICELMPMISPCMLSSGPPELPWLMAASVWIASRIAVTPFGAWISRLMAETMPEVTVRSRPNGLPMATTPSPTLTSAEEPSGIGFSDEAGTSTLSSATSVAGSEPTTRASTRSLLEKDTKTVCAPSTTCALVTM